MWNRTLALRLGAWVSLVVVAAACSPGSATPPVQGTTGQPACGDDAAAGSASAAAKASAPTPPDMALIAGGPFLRGSLPGVGLDDEHPQRSIVLATFFIDRTEVRQRDYAECVTAGACPAPRCNADRAIDWDPAARGAHPVVCIGWEEARAYCTFRGKRLPTEAEWEKAARGADGRPYPWGSAAPTCERANYEDCDHHDTLAVGSLPAGATPEGVFDLAGNVWEWVADWHMADYYDASAARDPEGPFQGEKKVVRGGAFPYGADDLLSAGRTFDLPEQHFEHVGVRCARSAR